LKKTINLYTIKKHKLLVIAYYNQSPDGTVSTPAMPSLEWPTV